MKWRLTEGSSEVTLRTATANVETEVIRITVPDTYRFLISQSILFDLTMKTADAVQLTDSAEITVYVARPDMRDQKFLGRFWYREVKNANAYDRNKQYFLRLDQALALPEQWHLIFKVKDSNIAASAQSLMQIDVEKIQV